MDCAHALMSKILLITLETDDNESNSLSLYSGNISNSKNNDIKNTEKYTRQRTIWQVDTLTLNRLFWIKLTADGSTDILTLWHWIDRWRRWQLKSWRNIRKFGTLIVEDVWKVKPVMTTLKMWWECQTIWDADNWRGDGRADKCWHWHWRPDGTSDSLRCWQLKRWRKVRQMETLTLNILMCNEIGDGRLTSGHWIAGEWNQ